MSRYQLLQGDCREVLKTLPDNSVDAVVTDPPYELGFMGKAWDSTGVAYDASLWREVFRVLKHGGNILSFGGSRTYHRMAVAIEDAGFEVRDQIMWVYGSGFPKSHNISKAMDKKGETTEQWNGWGTALKPAHEPIVLARKPLEGTVAENVLKWGVGGLNIDDCRVGDYSMLKSQNYSPQGRFPANLMHDGSQEVLDLFPESKGGSDKQGVFTARFFYCSKASKSDRDEGCESLPTQEKPAHMRTGNGTGETSMTHGFQPTQRKNTHPTVKPTELMRYLVRLITPPNGIVLDPFNGSGSTGKASMLEGMQYIGIEINPEYIKIAEARIENALRRRDGKPCV